MRWMKIVLVLIIVAALSFGGFLFYRRFLDGSRVLGEMMQVMSQIETANVKIVFQRFSTDDDRSFAFGDAELDGVVDLRDAPNLAYDLKLQLAVAPRVGSEFVFATARQVAGKTFVRIDDAPRTFLSAILTAGITKGEWVELESADMILEVFGEDLTLMLDSEGKIAQLRTLISEGDWFLDPQATITEIVHGRVTRIYTARLNPDAAFSLDQALFHLNHDRAPNSDEAASIDARRSDWESTRMSLWINQESKQLDRAILQFGGTSQIDIEFDSINEPVTILLPGEEMNLPEAEMLDVSARPAILEEEDTLEIEESAPAEENADTDGDGLSDELEGFYGSDINNPDTDGDGFLDGEEVKGGYSPTGTGSLFNFGLPTL